MKWKYNPPGIVKNLFSDFQWNSIIPKVLITFDDGPNSDTTELILKELSDNSIKSIFFTVGENVLKYPTLVKEIISEGHEIGNHTFKHQRITELKRDESIRSINKLQKILSDQFDYKIKYFRPPHGRFNFQTKSILRETELQNVMWSLLTYDYKNNLNIVKFAISNYLRSNSIIVLHDSNKSKNIIVDSIKLIVEEINKNNYQNGKPSECLKYYS